MVLRSFRRPAVLVSVLLLGGAGSGCGVGIFLGEAFDAACSVHELLLSGEERMAIRADFDAHHVALDGRARLKCITAGAMHHDGVIIGVNTGFHWSCLSSRPVCTAARLGRANSECEEQTHTAASLGREQFLIIREESNFAKCDRFGLHSI